MKDLQDTLTFSAERLQVERKRIIKLSTELNQKREQLARTRTGTPQVENGY